MESGEKNLMEKQSPEERALEVNLARFDTGSYSAGRGFLIRTIWFLINALVLQNPFAALSRTKRLVLRLFGAKIGKNVYFKPRINVKYPWLLTIGDDCWIGEGVWLDNLVPIIIGNNVCISQEAYLCTGNHDWSDISMPYRLGEIVVEDGAWIGARAFVGPKVKVARNSIISAGSVLTKSTEPNGIYSGNPAQWQKKRILKESAPR
jgi:putative colanic acid biosynthesis acetyltransferase WcaF